MNTLLADILKKIKEQRDRSLWGSYLLLAMTLLVLFYCLGAKLQAEMHWRAVFMANNQVYFGKFTYLPFSPNIRLRHIYYLQLSQPLQQASDQITNSTQIKLIKLGKELHGPADMMVIPKYQILFWENLAPSSELIKAITEQKKK